MDDIVESAKPPKPPKPSSPDHPDHADHAERRTSLLLHVVAISAVAIAVSTGIIAWETHQERAFNKDVYCSFNAGSELDPQTEELSDRLGC